MTMQTWTRRLAMTVASTALAAGAVAVPAAAASAAPVSQATTATAITENNDGWHCYKKFWDGDRHWFCYQWSWHAKKFRWNH